MTETKTTTELGSKRVNTCFPHSVAVGKKKIEQFCRNLVLINTDEYIVLAKLHVGRCLKLAAVIKPV